MSDMAKYNAHVQRAAERASREIAKRALAFRKLTTEELQSVRATSPWERAALRRVLRERGDVT